MLAIIKKDIRSSFHTVIGWLFIAVLWLFLSYFVLYYNFLNLSSSLASPLGTMELIMIILIPILCMRSFADEKRQKTDQVLFTAPVSVGKVVLGKFIALAVIFTVPVLMLCMYPLIFSAYGTVAFLENYVAIIGFWLLGLACIAICVFASSLTENPLIAAVISFLILFLIYLVPSFSSAISSSSTAVSNILDALSMFDQYEAFLNGTLSVTAIIYLGSVIFLFLFLTTQVIQKRRYSVSRKTLSFGVYSSAMIVVALAITVVVNVVGAKLPTSLQSIDLTSNKMYSITDDTKDFMKDLDQDVTIYVLSSKKDSDDTLNKTLEQYKEMSDHVEVTYIDPAEDPTFIQQYTDDTSSLYQNSLVVESGDRYKIINYSDIYESSIDYETYSSETTGYDAEGQITSAISYVTSDDMPKVYLLTNHGEQSLGSSFTEALSKLNIDSAELDLMTEDAVPDDAQAVLILSPTSDLSTDDVDKLEAFFDKGGNVIVTTNYEADGEMTNFKSLLSYFGITLGDGIVMDDDDGRYYRYPSYLLPVVAPDDITSDVTSGNGYILMPFAQPLTTDDSSEDVTFTTLLSTSESGYVHESADTEADLQKTSDDKTGTQIVGVKAEKKIDDDTTSTAVVYSSEYLFSDDADQMVSGSNSQLFSGSVSAVTEASESSISIPAKEFGDTSLTVSAGSAIMIGVIFIILIPAALVIAGVAIWLVRRRK